MTQNGLYLSVGQLVVKPVAAQQQSVALLQTNAFITLRLKPVLNIIRSQKLRKLMAVLAAQRFLAGINIIIDLALSQRVVV